MRTLLTILTLAVLAVCAGARAEEMRGVWVDAFGPGFMDKGQVRQLGDDCRKYNFNAVFVQMRKRGDALYIPQAPNIEPRNPDVAKDFDALAEVLRECHGREPRIQVHCWLVAYLVYAWDRPPPEKEHIFNRHPEYFTRDSIGQKFIAKGYYLDPGHPGVGAELLQVARDIASRYEIDGLHWDYLRYPEQDSGYNEVALRRYNEEFGLSGKPKPGDARFCEWRRRQVTDFLRWSTAELLAIRPGLAVSAAVFADHGRSRDSMFVDWAEWNREGILDASVPMDFTSDNRFVFEPRAKFAADSQGGRAVWLGLGSYMNSKEATARQMGISKSLGLGGTVLYCYRKPAAGVAIVMGDAGQTRTGTDDDGQTPMVPKGKAKRARQEAVFAHIKAQCQPQWEPAPVLPWKLNPARGIIKGTVSGPGGEPVYNAVVELSGEPARTQKTEPHGKFAFFDVPPGTCRVRAVISGKAGGWIEAAVKVGEVVDLKVAAESGGEGKRR